MLGRVAQLFVALSLLGCSGGTRRAPTNVVQTARRLPATNETSTATTERAKCPRRHLTTTEDGRDMVVYTEDTGSCEPARAASVTRVAAK